MIRSKTIFSSQSGGWTPGQLLAERIISKARKKASEGAMVALTSHSPDDTLTCGAVVAAELKQSTLDPWQFSARICLAGGT
jgi:hypothetical protein